MNKIVTIFFYKGKYFDNEKEFFDYVNEWPFKITSELDFNEMFEHLRKDIWMNLEMNQLSGTLTNGACNEIIEELFLIAFQKFIGKRLNENQ